VISDGIAHLRRILQTALPFRQERAVMAAATNDCQTAVQGRGVGLRRTGAHWTDIG
jgi:hypothetical protein